MKNIGRINHINHTLMNHITHNAGSCIGLKHYMPYGIYRNEYGHGTSYSLRLSNMTIPNISRWDDLNNAIDNLVGDTWTTQTDIESYETIILLVSEADYNLLALLYL